MNRKALTLGLLLVAGGALAVIATADLGDNLVYYWSPSEMLQKGEDAHGATVRLGGLIEAGSIQQSGLDLQFKVSDGKGSVLVKSKGTPPAMFREGIGVVVEGSLQRDGTFACDRMMIKHDNDYRAPTDGQKPSMESVVEG